MNTHLDISEYTVDRKSMTEDLLWKVISLLKLHLINEAIRDQDPGREARDKHRISVTEVGVKSGLLNTKRIKGDGAAALNVVQEQAS